MLAQHTPVQRVSPAMLAQQRPVQRASPAMLAQHRPCRPLNRLCHPFSCLPSYLSHRMRLRTVEAIRHLRSAPSVKRQRQLPASSSCAHSKSLAPPFHKDACGNHLRDKSRILAVWVRKGRTKLPKSYRDDKCPEMPSIDFVLEFFQFRHDRNSAAMSNKLGKPEQQQKGWRRIPILPITSPG